MSTIANYFLQAQLSLAAYAIDLQRRMFRAVDFPAYVTALVNAGMFQKQAEVFADTYAVIDQFADPLTGFSATVFAKGTEVFFDPKEPPKRNRLFGRMISDSSLAT